MKTKTLTSLLVGAALAVLPSCSRNYNSSSQNTMPTYNKNNGIFEGKVGGSQYKLGVTGADQHNNNGLQVSASMYRKF